MLPNFSQFFVKKLRGTGFEPAQALSYTALNRTRLATPAPPQRFRPLKTTLVLKGFRIVQSLELHAKRGSYSEGVHD